MERNVEPLGGYADGVSWGELSSAHPVYDAQLSRKVTAYLAALGFQDHASRHELVREISERLGPRSGNDPGETIEGCVIQAALHVIDHRLARAFDLGGRRDKSMGALARAELDDPRVRRACLDPHHVRRSLREYEIPFPGSFITPPIPPSLPTSMPEQRLERPSLKGLAWGWRGWLRFYHALRNTLAKIPG